ncbi:MAG TPA: hypothetical protein VFY36_11640 [Solirubrobacteraceae bacterium]|nr:hypothetical protein [Solirubrobacteraceae bacterium]
MARMLIVGGGCPGRQLAAELVGEGHAVRVTTRSEAGRAAIESRGAECWVGTPDRLATLRGALDSVTLVFWLLGGAVGGDEELRALYGSRLELFLTQAIDTTVRGFVYGARGTTVPADVLADGERTVRAMTGRSAIPAAFLTSDPSDVAGWIAEARRAVDDLLGM